MNVIDLGKIVNDGKIGAPSSKKSKNDEGAPKEEPVQPPAKRQTRGMKKKAEEVIKVVTQDEDFVKDLVDKKVKAKSSKEMVDEEWDCPACTFKNKAKSICEMCETPKPRVLLPVVKEWEEKMIASRKKDESEKEIKFNGKFFLIMCGHEMCVFLTFMCCVSNNPSTISSNELSYPPKIHRRYHHPV